MVERYSGVRYSMSRRCRRWRRHRPIELTHIEAGLIRLDHLGELNLPQPVGRQANFLRRPAPLQRRLLRAFLVIVPVSTLPSRTKPSLPDLVRKRWPLQFNARRSGGSITYSWRKSDPCHWHCVADDERRTVAGEVIRLGHARYQIRLRRSHRPPTSAPRLVFEELDLAQRAVEAKLKASVASAC
jgi:hypothetical protein